ncbi:MAG: hypothetical protein QM766_27580 [Burkholderiaceae bacterium]
MPEPPHPGNLAHPSTEHRAQSSDDHAPQQRTNDRQHGDGGNGGFDPHGADCAIASDITSIMDIDPAALIDMLARMQWQISQQQQQIDALAQDNARLMAAVESHETELLATVTYMITDTDRLRVAGFVVNDLRSRQSPAAIEYGSCLLATLRGLGALIQDVAEADETRGPTH